MLYFLCPEIFKEKKKPLKNGAQETCHEQEFQQRESRYFDYDDYGETDTEILGGEREKEGGGGGWQEMGPLKPATEMSGTAQRVMSFLSLSLSLYLFLSPMSFVFYSCIA